MFSSMRRLIVPACLVGCAVVSAAVVARAQVGLAQAVAAPAANAPAAEAPAPQPVAAPAVAIAGKPAVEYPQVNMAGFSREYRTIPMHSAPADEQIRRALRQPTPKRLDFQEAPLRAVLAGIQEDSGLPVVMDWQALQDAGIDVDAATVTHTVPAGMSLGAALRLVLRDCGLTWIAGDEVLMVTTKEKAQERPIVVAYPLPQGVCDVGPPDFQATIDLIQSAVAAHSWDAVGGMGSVKPLEAGDDPLLVVSQTCEVHEEVERILRRVHERMLAEFTDGRPVLRVHHVADRDIRVSLGDSLKNLCNASLGKLGDTDAEVTVVGDSVAVLSKSPEFHALAAQTIAAVTGVVERAPPGGPQGCVTLGGATFCWVAREVYGSGDPRWLVFRGWMVDEAPRWLRHAYAAFGPDVATWLRGRPVAKTVLRRLMDAVVEPRLAGTGVSTVTALP